MRITLDLDRTTTERLAASAGHELRPVTLQAYVLLMRQLGIPFPRETPSSDLTSNQQPAGVAGK